MVVVQGASWFPPTGSTLEIGLAIVGAIVTVAVAKYFVSTTLRLYFEPLDERSFLAGDPFLNIEALEQGGLKGWFDMLDMNGPHSYASLVTIANLGYRPIRPIWPFELQFGDRKEKTPMAAEQVRPYETSDRFSVQVVPLDSDPRRLYRLHWTDRDNVNAEHGSLVVNSGSVAIEVPVLNSGEDVTLLLGSDRPVEMNELRLLTAAEDLTPELRASPRPAVLFSGGYRFLGFMQLVFMAMLLASGYLCAWLIADVLPFWRHSPLLLAAEFVADLFILFFGVGAAIVGTFEMVEGFHRLIRGRPLRARLSAFDAFLFQRAQLRAETRRRLAEARVGDDRERPAPPPKPSPSSAGTDHQG